MIRHCEVCAAEFTPTNKTGPKPRRCQKCHSRDARVSRPPKGYHFAPHPCTECGAETARKYRCETCAMKRQRERTSAWHKEHPERSKEVQRRYRERHPDRIWPRAAKYGVSEVAFKDILGLQGGRCAICGGDEPGSGGWNLDHDHRHERRDPSGHRGVLCRSCNLMLGNARDEEGVLLAAVEYLRRHCKKGVRAA